MTGVHQETPTDQPSMLLSSTAGRKTLQNHSMKFAPSVQPESNIELLYVPPECQAFPFIYSTVGVAIAESHARIMMFWLPLHSPVLYTRSLFFWL